MEFLFSVMDLFAIVRYIITDNGNGRDPRPERTNGERRFMTRTSLEIIFSDKVQSLLDDFAALLDVRVTFFSIDGRRLLTGKDICKYCSIIQRELGGLSRCEEMDWHKLQETINANGPISYRCHAGLHEALSPIFVHKQLVGYLMIGQFRTDDEFPMEARDLTEDPEVRRRLESAFGELPMFPPKKLAGVLGFFKILIDYIAVRELAMLRGDVLRSEIDRYMDRHLAENIMLPDMARRLGRSVSTISQFLRRNYHTGFKELLNEKRIARAESFWKAHPDATVAEAAAAAGFSDQFYFSRVFRKRRGISPGKFRDRLRVKQLEGGV